MMKVLIRCDASTRIGSGHVIRCLTLADGLARKGARVVFACLRQPGDLTQLIEQRGYEVHHLGDGLLSWEDDAERTATLAADCGGVSWLVVDHYRLDARFESRLQQQGLRILVLDDLADRHHDCDLLLDQNLCRDMEHRYDGLLPAACRTLLGPSYALLRPEFLQARRELQERKGDFKRLLISFGGADPTNETAKTLVALGFLGNHGLLLDVVVGASNPHAISLQADCAALPGCSFHTQIDTMAAIMSRADLAVGSGGATTWERCFLGLPSLVVVVARNQLLLTEAVTAAGAAWNLGWHSEVSPMTIADQIVRLREAPEQLAMASAAGFSLMGEAAGNVEHPLVTLMCGEGNDRIATDAA